MDGATGENRAIVAGSGPKHDPRAAERAHGAASHPSEGNTLGRTASDGRRTRSRVARSRSTSAVAPKRRLTVLDRPTADSHAVNCSTLLDRPIEATVPAPRAYGARSGR